MLSVPGSVRIFLFRSPTDMRKSFDGLLGLVREAFVDEDPLSGDLFLFVNRRRDRLKVLMWDRDGLVIWYKLLEAGTFQLPAGDQPTLELTSQQWAMLLGGIDLNSARLRKRYRRTG